MNRISFLSAALVLAIPVCAASVFGDELKPIQLLKPQFYSGRPLMSVLQDRHSSRSFSNEKLPVRVLSNLLWAAFGVNRTETGKRTAPSAMNHQEIDIFVATAEGLYLYDAKVHTLNPILSGDIRAMTGRQGYVNDAAVNLIYVADYSRMGTGAAQDTARMSGLTMRASRRRMARVIKAAHPCSGPQPSRPWSRRDRAALVSCTSSRRH